MRTHQKIIKDAGGATKVAEVLSASGRKVSANTVQGWAREDSISADFWNALADAELATLEELAAYREHKRLGVAGEEKAA